MSTGSKPVTADDEAERASQGHGALIPEAQGFGYLDFGG